MINYVRKVVFSHGPKFLVNHAHSALDIRAFSVYA